MSRVPFIGRLNVVEYLALFSSFFLVALEAIIRIFTQALPNPVITIFYRISRRLFNRFTSSAAKKSATKRNDISSRIRDASDFVDLCALFGYYAEEHVVQTGDGYLLGLHRLGCKRGEEGQKVNRGKDGIKKRVVYLHHGLLMNSEVWVCLTDEERCLPFTLVERGFDVWLGNNRGNKYSKKSTRHSSNSIAFWDFSMDEFAFHDIPDTISYILSTTEAPSLSYIGFSQGTAQAFAALAVHPKLNEQVNVFIALAPAMAPGGLSNGIVDALVKASPHLLFLLFGRKSILSATTMWQSIVYPPIYVKVIDASLGFLFGWKASNMSLSQKLAAYPHLYSFTSTKSVVHWFQILRNKSFQMYDDDIQSSPYTSATTKFHTKVAKFPTRNIKTPIVLLYGGSDSLVDIGVMMKELPAHTIATEVAHYEHLDFLWAREVATLVFPHVFDALDSFTDAKHTKEEFAKYRAARHASITAGSQPPSYASEDERSEMSSYANLAAMLPPSVDSDVTLPSGIPRPNASSGFPSPAAKRRAMINSNISELVTTAQVPPTDDSNSSPEVVQSSNCGLPSSPRLRDLRGSSEAGTGLYDGTAGGETSPARKLSVSSLMGSLGRNGAVGISLGAAKAAQGVVSSGEGVGLLTGSQNDKDSDGNAGGGSMKKKKAGRK